MHLLYFLIDQGMFKLYGMYFYKGYFMKLYFSILALFLSFSSVLTYSILPYIAHSHSQQDVPSDIQSSALQLSDNCGIVQKRDMASVQRVCEVCYATQENMRGINGEAAYPNQDRIFIGSLAGRVGFGVFDGHGKEYGGYVAAYVRDALLIKIMGYKSLALGASHACRWMQNELKENKYKEAKEAGTTAVMGVLYDKTLTIINVGDSRAVKINADRTQVKQLSTDHKPQIKTEQERIKNAGGFVHNGYVYNKLGYGLAISRSLGDLSAHDNEVITCEPEIEIYSVGAGDTLLFCSDGFWDVVSNERARELVVAYEGQSKEEKQKQSCAAYLAQEARKLKSHDDITVLVATVK